MSKVKNHVVTCKRARLPAAVLLGLSAAVCAVYAFVTSGSVLSGEDSANGASGLSIAELEKRIADGCTSADTWLSYARVLKGKAQYTYAQDAYRKVLAVAPFERDAQLELAECLALTGSQDELKTLLEDLAMNDAKLAVEIMGRAEMGSYMLLDSFQIILEEARNQAND